MEAIIIRTFIARSTTGIVVRRGTRTVSTFIRHGETPTTAARRIYGATEVTFRTRVSSGAKKGQGWWLRSTATDRGGFVEVPRIGARYAERFDEKVDLAPGSYVLGCGRGRDAVRIDIFV